MKRSLRTRAFPVGVLLMAFGIAGVLGVAAVQRTADAQDAEFVLKFATVAPDGTPWTDQLTAIKKRVENESGGRIKFKLYSGSRLGGEVETIRKCARNQIQGWGGSTAAVAEGVNIPQLQVFELPFMFNSEAEVDFVMDSMFDPMAGLLEAKGFELAYWHVNGWHNFATKAPIRTPADLAGMKMRSQESPVHLSMFKALGAQPQTIPVPEVLGALQTNMVDGFSNTPLFTGATGWYEGGITHYTITHHIYQPAAIIYSKEFYDSLPADLQTVLIGDRAAETRKGRESVREMTPALLEMFTDSGIDVVELTDAERQAFADLCTGVPDEFNDTIGTQIIAGVRASVTAYRKKAGN